MGCHLDQKAHIEFGSFDSDCFQVFNATPGRLTSAQHNFTELSPRPSTASTQKRLSVEDLAAELATHVHHLSPVTNLPLPPLDASHQLSSSPGQYPPTRSRFDDKSNAHVTPKKSKKRLEGSFSAQTATPPATKSKGSRKLARKTTLDTMQNDSQESHYGVSQTPTFHQNNLSFPPNSADFFCPMSVPATAPVFTATRPFWDPDESMAGMDLDFGTDNTSMFGSGTHRMGNSLDWGRSDQMFQGGVNVSAPSSNVSEQSTIKRPRPLAPKLPKSSTPELLPSTMAPYDFSGASVSDDPFSPSALGGVDPGLLFSRSNLVPMTSRFQDVSLPPSRPVTSHVEQLQPYQHQLRESMRDQEELRRSRSSRESSRTRRFERGTVSSPVKGSARPGPQRSISENRGKRIQGNTRAPPSQLS